MRACCYMYTHRMKLNWVNCVFVSLQVYTFLEFVFRIQTPQLDWFVGRGSRDIWSVRANLSTHGMKPNVNYSVSVSLQLSSKLTVRNTPNFACSTPTRCCKKFFVRWNTPTTYTPIISILRLNDLKGSNTVHFAFNFDCIVLLCQASFRSNYTKL